MKHLLPTEPPVEGVESHHETKRAQRGKAKIHQAMVISGALSPGSLTKIIILLLN